MRNDANELSCSTNRKHERMKYKPSSTGEARTSDYIGTVTNLHDSDLERIRQNVKLHNSEVRTTSRKHGREIESMKE